MYKEDSSGANAKEVRHQQWSLKRQLLELCGIKAIFKQFEVQNSAVRKIVHRLKTFETVDHLLKVAIPENSPQRQIVFMLKKKQSKTKPRAASQILQASVGMLDFKVHDRIQLAKDWTSMACWKGVPPLSKKPHNSMASFAKLYMTQPQEFSFVIWTKRGPNDSSQ